MKLLRAIPSLPVQSISKSAAFYRDQLGFTVHVEEEGFAILRHGPVDIHLWASNDESWRERNAAQPIVSGAESFIAGTASCRIGVEEVDDLYQTFEPRGVMHPNGHISDTEWNTREFGVLDLEGNLITFFERK
jgi:catechol 2,3-dioxygenase-like lactoylglutathione lyase family enzyme